MVGTLDLNSITAEDRKRISEVIVHCHGYPRTGVFIDGSVTTNFSNPDWQVTNLTAGTQYGCSAITWAHNQMNNGTLNYEYTGEFMQHGKNMLG